MSNSKLYVGNLSFDLDENAIRSEFEKCGTVTDVYVATDKFTGRPRGFAFVTMGSPEEAKTAIDQLNNQELAGRALSVSEARPKESGGGFGGGGGGGGGRKFGGGGGGGGGGGRREGSYGGRRDGGGRGRY